MDVEIKIFNSIINSPENCDYPVELGQILKSLRCVQDVEVVVMVLDQILD